MNKMMYLLMFAAGVATGVAATWQYFKTKYEQIADEEIDSVKSVFARLEENARIEREESIETNNRNYHNEETKLELKQRVEQLNYAGYYDKTEEVKPVEGKRPYVIEPGEFDENGYETSTLFYYADGQLVDDDDRLVEDIDGTVGYEALDHFGEFEDDSVFVRNDELEMDYEILLDHRKFSDVLLKKKPQG